MKTTTKIIICVIIAFVLTICAFIFFINTLQDINHDTPYDKNTNQSIKNLSDNSDVFYVYEEEVDSAEDCTEFEKYDAERGVCFFECESEEECAEINQKIDTIFEEFEGEYKEFSKDFKEFEGDSQVLEDNTEVVYIIK